MSQADDISVPASTPRPAKGGLGCATTVILFIVIVVLGLVVGTVLSGDDDDDAEGSAETISDGIAQEGGRERPWRVDAEVDETGDTCVFLYEGTTQVTGSCDDTPQAATLGDETIVFGRVASAAATATVDLSDASQVAISTFPIDGFDGRFYVEVVDREVDAVRLASG